MFTDAPAVSSASSSRAASSTGVVWWCSPQWSNQPSQNSEHISGPVGWWRRSVASRSAAREPKLPVLCSSGRLPASSISSVGWSTVVRGTTTPEARVRSTRCRRYPESSPYAPYSFSICTSTTGPPWSIWRGTTIS